MNRGTKRNGYTLVEAMVSAVLISVGLVAVLGGYSNISRNQRIAIQSEQMQRLAVDKYEELVATEALQTQSLNGDFSDRGDNNYLWQAAVTATGTENLSSLVVTVTSRQEPDSTTKGVVNGVVYIQPQTTTTGSTGAPTP